MMSAKSVVPSQQSAELIYTDETSMQNIYKQWNEYQRIPSDKNKEKLN
jgi:hypothetical protein